MGTVTWDWALHLCHVTLSSGQSCQNRVNCRTPSWGHRELLRGHTFGDQKCQKLCGKFRVSWKRFVNSASLHKELSVAPRLTFSYSYKQRQSLPSPWTFLGKGNKLTQPESNALFIRTLKNQCNKFWVQITYTLAKVLRDEWGGAGRGELERCVALAFLWHPNPNQCCHPTMFFARAAKPVLNTGLPGNSQAKDLDLMMLVGWGGMVLGMLLYKEEAWFTDLEGPWSLYTMEYYTTQP